MKKISLVLAIAMLSLTSVAQKDEAGAKECLENYMSGEPARLEKAFHPSATMKYIDYKTGEFKDVPIAEYIERAKTNSATNTGAKLTRKIEVVSMNVEGSAAQAKIKIETEKVIMYDYMNLLKVGNEWKIVSKILNRQDK